MNDSEKLRALIDKLGLENAANAGKLSAAEKLLDAAEARAAKLEAALREIQWMALRRGGERRRHGEILMLIAECCSSVLDGALAGKDSPTCDDACREEGKCSGYCAGDGDALAGKDSPDA